MAQGVQDFYTSIRENGFSQSHLFRIVQIASDLQLDETYLLYGTTSEIPARKIEMVSGLAHRGFETAIPTIANSSAGNRNITLTFYCDEKLNIYDAFFKWHRSYWDERNFRGKFFNFDNVFHMMILDADTKVVRDVKLYGCFPIELKGLKYSFSDDSKIQTFDISIYYQYFDITIPGEQNDQRGFFGRLLDGIGGVGDLARGIGDGVQAVRDIF